MDKYNLNEQEMEAFKKNLQAFYDCSDIINETCEHPYQAMFVLHQLIVYVADRMGRPFKDVVKDIVKVEKECNK